MRRADEEKKCEYNNHMGAFFLLSFWPEGLQRLAAQDPQWEGIDWEGLQPLQLVGGFFQYS